MPRWQATHGGISYASGTPGRNLTYQPGTKILSSRWFKGVRVSGFRLKVEGSEARLGRFGSVLATTTPPCSSNRQPVSLSQVGGRLLPPAALALNSDFVHHEHWLRAMVLPILRSRHRQTYKRLVLHKGQTTPETGLRRCALPQTT